MWIQKGKLSRFRSRVWLSAMAALVYSVWFQRNRKLWRKEVIQKAEVLKRVKYDVKNRARTAGINKISIENIGWFVEL